MLYTPEKAFKFIMATAVLHNMRRDLNLQEDEEFEVPTEMFLEEDDDGIQEMATGNELLNRGHAIRDEIRLGFFQ